MKRSIDEGQPSNAPKKQKTDISVAGVSGAADGGGEWTRVEKRKVKKAKKHETKLDNSHPRFMYANAEITKRKTAVGIEDIRDLILHIIGDAPPPNWVKVQNARAITKIVAILVPGLTPALLNLPPLPTSATANPNLPLAIPLPDPENPSASAIAWVANTFSHACPTRAPGEPTRMHSVLSAFFHGPVSGEEKRKRMAVRVASERTADRDPSRYALTLEQMVENDYPIPSYMADIFQKPDSMWVETPAPPQASLLDAAEPQTHKKVKTKVYAIDCEMCLTEDGKELTRVCVIDYYSGAVVYDQLVKPPKPIVDYLTQWSGITKEALEGITTTLPTVQAAILALLVPASSPTPTPTPILLGHSLESDLRALKLCHPACIDTALTYHHPRGRPLKPGLAWLTRKWCGRVIQARGAGGHDPEEDARACVELLRKKLENGAGFGEFKTDFESMFERLSRSGEGGVKAAVVDHGNPGVMHGAKAGTCVGCTSDSEVVDAVVEVVPGHEFVFGRLTGLAAALGWLTPKDTSAPGPAGIPTATPIPEIMSAPPPAEEPSAESLIPVLTTLNTHLTQIHASLPPRTALVLFTGHADPRRMAALQARKNAFEAALRAGKTAENIERELWWTAADGRELEEEVEVARRGVVFLGIK